jgi:two-component system sensor histidine kinase BaeS
VVNLPVLLGLIAEQYSPVAAEAGIAIRLDTEPALVRADEDRIIQVLVNLVDNALRHTPCEKAIILGCRLEEQWSSFWVTDEGSGIAAEHLPHLGERFYRIERHRDRARGGIGLGLSICKSIVAAHDGTITITSTPGVGTTVTVRLPVTATFARDAALEHDKASVPEGTLVSHGLPIPGSDD